MWDMMALLSKFVISLRETDLSSMGGLKVPPGEDSSNAVLCQIMHI